VNSSGERERRTLEIYEKERRKRHRNIIYTYVKKDEGVKKRD
jgi:hypothetical protein